MAKFDYSSYESQKKAQEKSADSKERKFEFFKSPKKVEDERIIRFPYKTSKEFDLANFHLLYKSKSERFPTLKINCLKELGSQDKCPLCESGEKPVSKFFCKFIEYKKDNTGKIVATPVVWEKTMGFAGKLNNFIEEYGDLSKCVFKLKWKNDKFDPYDLFICKSEIYPDSIYTKDFSSFEGLEFDKILIKNKSLEEMQAYLESGEFPPVVSKNKGTQTETTSKPVGTTSKPVVGPQPEQFRSSEEPKSNTPTSTTTSSPRRYNF